MNKYISILRGINVSGQKKILMADLKSLYEGLGFTEVLTYIQSGNVIFTSTITSKQKLKSTLEESIKEKYAFHVPVDVFSQDEFTKILDNLPFEVIDLEREGTKFLITFLSEKPAQDCIIALQQYVNAPEKLKVVERAVYLHCPNGYGRSKLSNAFIENKLKVSATTRNLKTANKLRDLVNL